MVNFIFSRDAHHDDRPGWGLLRSQLLRRDVLHDMEWVQSISKRHPLPPTFCLGEDISYLARAEHCASWTPGFLDASRKRCFIVWGGKVHKKKDFEVLCTPGKFVACTDTNTLLRATPAGVSEQGEPLYIGRVNHEGHYVYGKVQRSHKVCYVPIKGKEHPFGIFDVFMNAKANPEVTSILALAKPVRRCHLLQQISSAGMLHGVALNSANSYDLRYDGIIRPQIRFRRSATWIVPMGGEVPRNSVSAGFYIEPLYIGRARHEGSITPGIVVPSERRCRIVWGGMVWLKDEYEMLVDTEGMFIASHGHLIPANALIAGRSETGEPLYIGRAYHAGTYTIGKVQASLGVCHIPYDGVELAFHQYDIYVITH